MKQLMEGTADSKRCPRGSRAAFAGLDADRGLLRFLRNIAKNRKSFQTSGFSIGSGRRIRTLTNRVRDWGRKFQIHWSPKRLMSFFSK